MRRKLVQGTWKHEDYFKIYSNVIRKKLFNSKKKQFTYRNRLFYSRDEKIKNESYTRI